MARLVESVDPNEARDEFGRIGCEVPKRSRKIEACGRPVVAAITTGGETLRLCATHAGHLIQQLTEVLAQRAHEQACYEVGTYQQESVPDETPAGEVPGEGR